ncbi:diacylglycerol/lipid kinase family protein [Allofustis seminis]|uniref:diacylglycerol/lipid kinase family protein n=1 Tax=Allofustis seminis TaxID=166939 RepID=UPI00037D61F1|nr:diacylglycerol kinase family protein [Allofustis seminis]
MKEVWVIVNPSSGADKATEYVGLLFNSYLKDAPKVTILQTRQAFDATEFAKQAAQAGAEYLFIMGGDGTINEGIQGLLAIEKSQRPILGIIPLGTTNNLARMLNYPLNIKTLIENFDQSKPIEMDVASVNDKYFVSTLSGGTVPESVQNADEDLKSTLGPLAYLIEGMRALSDEKVQKFYLNMDGQDERVELGMFVVGNSNMIFGIPNFFPEARIDDGKLHFMGLKETTSLEKISLVPNLLMNDTMESEHIVSASFEEATIEVEGTHEHAVTIDGDVGPHYPIHVAIHPKEIKVLYFENE